MEGNTGSGVKAPQGRLLLVAGLGGDPSDEDLGPQHAIYLWSQAGCSLAPEDPDSAVRFAQPLRMRWGRQGRRSYRKAQGHPPFRMSRLYQASLGPLNFGAAGHTVDPA
jgi:hypothetical protein